METKKEKYIAPAIEVICMEQEGVIAASGNVGDYEGDVWTQSDDY